MTEESTAPVESTAEPAAQPEVTTTLSPEPVTAAAPEPAPVAEAAPEPVGMPDNWRSLMAGENDKALKQLERYSTPEDMASALIEAKQKIREGLAVELPDDPTDEQLADYRTKHGIPESHSDYEIKLDDGLVIGDDDKPIVDGFLEAMHGQNATPNQINAGLNAYYKMQEQAFEDQQVLDTSHSQEANKALKDIWGSDYTSNINAVQAALNTVPEAVRDEFAGARLSDGRALFNSPEIMQWLSDQSRAANPAATVMPNATNPVQAVNDEIKQLENLQRTDPQAYWGDQSKQDRLRALYGAQG